MQILHLLHTLRTTLEAEGSQDLISFSQIFSFLAFTPPSSHHSYIKQPSYFFLPASSGISALSFAPTQHLAQGGHLLQSLQGRARSVKLFSGKSILPAGKRLSCKGSFWGWGSSQRGKDAEVAAPPLPIRHIPLLKSE